ncbi:MAG: FAD-dependent oxidoreductase, partial [Deltaproteobacteria bacterium]|nr:FAD-dependent oxidoreductase [Deltaproteobacteria bacterium]
MGEHYDIAVIGSGPAGQKAAIQAAKLGKRAVIIDRPHSVGGSCIQRGAIPSKTLREAVLYYTGFYHRHAYRAQEKKDLTMQDLMHRCETVVDNETRVVLRQLERNHVDLVEGEASFVDPHTLKISGNQKSLTADYFLIATGTVPTRPDVVPFEDGLIIDAEGLATFSKLPRNLLVVGAGVIGTEYASILALLDIEVTLIDQRSQLLDFVDAEVSEALAYHLRDIGMTLYFD